MQAHSHTHSTALVVLFEDALPHNTTERYRPTASGTPSTQIPIFLNSTKNLTPRLKSCNYLFLLTTTFYQYTLRFSILLLLLSLRSISSTTTRNTGVLYFSSNYCFVMTDTLSRTKQHTARIYQGNIHNTNTNELGQSAVMGALSVG